MNAAAHAHAGPHTVTPFAEDDDDGRLATERIRSQSFW